MMNGRIEWLLIGCAIGFIIGYLVRSLREIKEKVNEVDRHITKDQDQGSTTTDWTVRAAALFAVLLTVFAAFKSQSTSNRVDRSTVCNQQYLGKTIAALNARTQFSQQQNAANVELQKAQSEYLNGVVKKTKGLSTPDTADLTKYLMALTRYTQIAGKSSSAVANNPYPTTKDFTDCVNNKD